MFRRFRVTSARFAKPSSLRFLRGQGSAAVEPTPEAQGAFLSSLYRQTEGTVWVAGGCRSWYLDRTGRSSAIWPDFTWRFRRRVARFRPREYVTLAQENT